MMTLKKFAFFCALVIFAPLALAQVPFPPIQASSWILYDQTGHYVLGSENADKRLPPASLTKLMSAYLTFEALEDGTLKIDEVVPVSEKAWKTGGSKMFIDTTTPVTVNELLHGMIVQSGNDATIALAEAIGGTEDGFVARMNQKAAELGLKNTHFTNASGLPDDNHYSSARDIAKLSSALIRDFPQYYKVYSIKEYKYKLPKPQYNRNRLLWIDPNVDGIKTGHTDAAGFCLAASKNVNGRRLISVVMGTSSTQARAEESLKLLNYGFQHYEDVLLYKKDEPVDKMPVYKGSRNSVAVGYPYNFYVPVPRGMRDKIKTKLLYPHPVIAPIAIGQRVGTLRVELNGKPYIDYPVFSLEPVGQAGWFGRMIDSIRLWF